MLRIIYSTIVISLGLLLMSCETAPEEKGDVGEPGVLDLIHCEEPRPQICTREYDPVCATLKDGGTKTYATGCTSCADTVVIGYSKGGCR